MPTLSDTELRMIAEIVSEMARSPSGSFDPGAKGAAFARAAMIDSAFKTQLAEVHRHLMARRVIDPRKMLSPITPLFDDLEREAEVVLSGWRAP